MSFTISAASNPQTRGKGDCFVVEADYERKRGAESPVSVMFDNYDVTPGVTARIAGPVRLNIAENIDDGCFFRFTNGDAELIVILPMSIRTLLHSIALYEDRDRVDFE